MPFKSIHHQLRGYPSAFGERQSRTVSLAKRARSVQVALQRFS
jgi:hypothetical protein